jgi:integrase
MSKRRDHGDGSLYPECEVRGPGHDDGDHSRCRIRRWFAQIEGPPGADGRRRFIRRSRRTKAEAAALLKDLIREREAGLVADRRTTVQTFADDWIDNVLPHTNVRPRTVSTYATVLRNYVLPSVGSIRLADLSVDDVEAMTQKLAAKGLSDLTIDHAVTTLGTLLHRAERHGYVTRNVAKLAKRDRARGKDPVKVKPLTADEAHAVLDAAGDHRLAIAARLALFLGLRKGEVLALRWSDIEHLDDDEPAVLHVRGTLRSLKGGGYVIEQPKSRTSTRSVPLNGVTEPLRRHRARQREERIKAGPLWRDTDAVVATERGGFVDPSQLHRSWHKWCEAAGAGRPRFHASRHTCATLLRRAGADLDHIAAVLGHTSIVLTSDIYADVSPADVADDLAKLDAVIDGAGKG